jgi:[NiFe] hydrogenase diaphorase moiety large subunit
MDKLAAGLGSPHDLAQITDLNRLLQAASHCGLGHTACNPVLDTLKRFRPAYEQRLLTPDYAPAFDLDGALARARAMTGRDDSGAHFRLAEAATAPGNGAAT